MGPRKIKRLDVPDEHREINRWGILQTPLVLPYVLSFSTSHLFWGFSETPVANEV